MIAISFRNLTLKLNQVYNDDDDDDELILQIF